MCGADWGSAHGGNEAEMGFNCDVSAWKASVTFLTFSFPLAITAEILVCVCERSARTKSAHIKWRWGRQQANSSPRRGTSLLPLPLVSQHLRALAPYLFHDKHFTKWTPAGIWTWKPDSSLIGPRAADISLFLFWFDVCLSDMKVASVQSEW